MDITARSADKLSVIDNTAAVGGNLSRMARTTIAALLTVAVVLTGTPALGQTHFVRGDLPTPTTGTPSTAPAGTDNNPAATGDNGAVAAVTVDAPARVDIPANAIAIEVGDDAADVVASSPAGSTFVFVTGTHRAVEIIARSGDTYLGEPGAVLDASVPVETTRYAEASNGLRQYHGLASDAITALSDSCAPWYEGGIAVCGHEQEVFRSELVIADGVRLRHVNSPSDVTADSFHYDAGNLALTVVGHHDDLRFSTADFAFAGYGVDDVTIAGLAVINYASPTQMGAIDLQGTDGWVLDGLLVEGNHGYGIRVGKNTTITNSLVTDNGHIGIGGAVDETSLTVVGNEISHNAWLGVQPGFEAGGLKVTWTVGAEVTHNYVHDNGSKGLWFDGYNVDATIAYNRIERSGQTGILYEISYDAAIHNNVVIDNHTSDDVTESFGNIQIVNSTNVDVFANVLSGGGQHELTAVDTGHAPGLSNLTVHDNLITIDTDWDAGSYGVKDLRHAPDAPLAGITFYDNDVHITGPQTRVFAMGDALGTPADWTAQHDDVIRF